MSTESWDDTLGFYSCFFQIREIIGWDVSGLIKYLIYLTVCKWRCYRWIMLLWTVSDVRFGFKWWSPAHWWSENERRSGRSFAVRINALKFRQFIIPVPKSCLLQRRIVVIILTWNKLFELATFFKCARQSWKFREGEIWGSNKTSSLCWYSLTHPEMSSFNDKMLLFQFYMHFFSNGFLKLNLIFCCEEDIRRVKGKKRKIMFSQTFFSEYE